MPALLQIEEAPPIEQTEREAASAHARHFAERQALFGNEAKRRNRDAVIELAVGKWQPAPVSRNILFRAGAMNARVGEHRRIGVEPGDIVARAGETPGEVTCTAADIEDACAGFGLKQAHDQSKLGIADPPAPGGVVPAIVLVRCQGHSALEHGKRSATQGREDHNSERGLLPEDKQSKRDKRQCKITS